MRKEYTAAGRGERFRRTRFSRGAPPMKIGMLVPGGVDRSGTRRVIPFLLWLIERIAAAGHELHVFALRQEPEPGEWQLLGATVHNAGGWRRPRMLADIAREHRRAAFDVLHAFWALPCGTLAAVAGAALRVPVILHLPGGDLADLGEINYGVRARLRGRAWLRLALAGAERVVVPSRFMLEQARALGIPAELVPYGVALDRWPLLPPRPRSADRPARLLHVASLNAVKDQGTLLRAAARLRAGGAAFHLDVVGEDTLGGRVQRQAQKLGLSREVTFHGFLPQDALRSQVASADILLISSRHEAGPIVLLEAAACGVPAVGTAVGHLRDWAPSAAVAVPVGDDAALARETAALLADDGRRLEVARRAQERVRSCDADVTAQRLLELSHEVRASRGG